MTRCNLYLINTLGSMRCELARSYPYQLVLAQPWIRSADYRENVAAIQEQHNPRIILDNGAHEGYQITPSMYMRVIEALRPHVVVLPDRIAHHHIESRTASLKYARAIEVRRNDTLVGYDPEFIYAPQGEDRGQIVEEFTWARNQLDPTRYIIGIGQSYLAWCKTAWECDGEDRRQEMMDTVLPSKPTDARYHILGARWRPLSLSPYLRDGHQIVGIDTVKPVWCAADLEMYPRAPKNPTPNYVDTVGVSDIQLERNIRSFCNSYGIDPPNGVLSE